MEAQKQQMAQVSNTGSTMIPSQLDPQAQNGPSLMQKESILPDSERQDFLTISPANQ